MHLAVCVQTNDVTSDLTLILGLCKKPAGDNKKFKNTLFFHWLLFTFLQLFNRGKIFELEPMTPNCYIFLRYYNAPRTPKIKTIWVQWFHKVFWGQNMDILLILTPPQTQKWDGGVKQYILRLLTHWHTLKPAGDTKKFKNTLFFFTDCYLPSFNNSIDVKYLDLV